jgi:hypothetical protein
MDPKIYYNAHIAARYITDSLLCAHERYNWCPDKVIHHAAIERAEKDMRELAAMFGFDLVKREPAKLEAAE